jgi:hypothetical protein
MSRYWLAISLALVVALAASAAAAEDAKSDPVVYEFSEDLVRGDLKTSSDTVLHVRKRGASEPLIRVREDWLVELFRTAEQL